MNREYNEAMDDLRFSPGAKERMAAHLTAAREQARSERPQPDVYAARGGKRRWRFAAAAAVTLVLAGGLAGGAYASGALMGVGNVMDDLFGGPPAQTEVVDKIGRPLGASATSNGVTVTAEAIIGDRANYTIVFSIAKDDGTPFEDIEALDNGLLPLGLGEAAGVHVDGVTTSGGSSHFYDADPSDNAIQYVEQMSVTSTSGSIIGHTARVCFQDLYRYGDGGREVLVEGTWNMKFVVDYEDTSIDLPAGQPFELNGMGARSTAPASRRSRWRRVHGRRPHGLDREGIRPHVRARGRRARPLPQPVHHGEHEGRHGPGDRRIAAQRRLPRGRQHDRLP